MSVFRLALLLSVCSHMFFTTSADAQDRSRSVLHKECVDGDASSCFALGDMWRFGEGGPKDSDRAIDYYTKACEMAKPVGCAEVGEHHWSQPEEKAQQKARRFFERGCEAEEDAYCCYVLGVMWSEGDGGRQDRSKAAEYVWKSCEYGRTESCDEFDRYYAYDSSGWQKDGKKTRKQYS